MLWMTTKMNNLLKKRQLNYSTGEIMTLLSITAYSLSISMYIAFGYAVYKIAKGEDF